MVGGETSRRERSISHSLTVTACHVSSGSLAQQNACACRKYHKAQLLTRAKTETVQCSDPQVGVMLPVPKGVKGQRGKVCKAEKAVAGGSKCGEGAQ